MTQTLRSTQRNGKSASNQQQPKALNGIGPESAGRLMSYQPKLLMALSAITGVALMAAVCMIISASRYWLSPFTSRHVREQHEAIMELLDELQTETYAQTVARLTNDDPLRLTWGNSGIKGYQPNLDAVLGNRRFQKLFQDLESLPRDQRAREHRRIFDMLLNEHELVFETGFLHAENPALPANKKSLLSTQRALGAVLWSTAASGDAELLLSQLDALDQLKARLQKRAEVSNARQGRNFTFFVQGYDVPDNRLLLNVQWLVLCNSAAHQAQNASHLLAGLESRTVDLVPWNAAISPFDAAHQRAGIPVDTSQGSVRITIYNWANPFDEQGQVALIDKMKRLIQDSIATP